MDYTTLQSRPPTAYFPPHRTQLHPRMHSSFSPSHTRQTKFLIPLASLFTIPFLFYIFTTARKLHQSTKFVNPTSLSYGVHIHSGPTRSRIRVFESLGDQQMPFVASMTTPRGLLHEDTDHSLQELLHFAKTKIPKREWGKTTVHFMATGWETKDFRLEVADKILRNYRHVLKASGFLFNNDWARLIKGEEESIYAWIAVNYASGTLGAEPAETNGIVKLGGDSMQVTFALRELSEVQSSQSVKWAGVTYDVYTQSLPQLGQDAAWESIYQQHYNRELTTLSTLSGEGLGNPCIPNGYQSASNVTEVITTSNLAGNFSMCRNEAYGLLKRKQDQCLHQPCEKSLSFFREIKGKPISPDKFFYISENFGLAPTTSLSEMMEAGRHYCENEWDYLKHQHHSVDELDLLRYCFSSAYTVALLHDNLGLPMHDKRIGFTNGTTGTPLDWTLGAFIYQSVLEPLEVAPEKLGQIVGSESVTYFSFFAFLLVALFSLFLVLQWRKPQLKTIYDLEKGRYIVTRLPR